MKYITLILIAIISFTSFAQKKDTIFIKFNDQCKEMKKESYQFSPNSGISYGYYIRQMEKNSYGDTHFLFSHAIRDKKTYQKFGVEPPLTLKKPKSFLDDKHVLDSEFFRMTPYIEVCKTFEEDDSWESDVMIFITDVNEIQNDSIILREVKFTRPVKE